MLTATTSQTWLSKLLISATSSPLIPAQWLVVKSSILMAITSLFMTTCAKCSTLWSLFSLLLLAQGWWHKLLFGSFAWDGVSSALVTLENWELHTLHAAFWEGLCKFVQLDDCNFGPTSTLFIMDGTLVSSLWSGSFDGSCVAYQ